MKTSLIKSVTLIELIVSIVLLSIIILAISGIDLFSRSHIVSSERIAKLQNEASAVLEHMSKEIPRAIGNMVIGAQYPLDFTSIGGNAAIWIYVDQNQNGQWDAGDRWIAYRYTAATGAQSDWYQIWYYDNYVGVPAGTHDVIGQSISTFTPIRVFGPSGEPTNLVDVNIVACWNPAAGNCGAANNPNVTMRTQIKMPAVSVN